MARTLGSREAALHLNYSRWKGEQVNFSPLKKESLRLDSAGQIPRLQTSGGRERERGTIKRRGEHCSGVLTWNQPAS